MPRCEWVSLKRVGKCGFVNASWCEAKGARGQLKCSFAGASRREAKETRRVNGNVSSPFRLRSAEKIPRDKGAFKLCTSLTKLLPFLTLPTADNLVMSTPFHQLPPSRAGPPLLCVAARPTRGGASCKQQRPHCSPWLLSQQERGSAAGCGYRACDSKNCLLN